MPCISSHPNLREVWCLFEERKRSSLSWSLNTIDSFHATFLALHTYAANIIAYPLIHNECCLPVVIPGKPCEFIADS